MSDPPEKKTGEPTGPGGDAKPGRHAHGDSTDGPGSATDALAALGSALAKAAEAKPRSTADPKVSAAFALGWHVAELDGELPAGRRRSLPGLSRLGKQQQVALSVNQVLVGVNALKQPVADAGLDAIDLTGLKALIRKHRHRDAVLATHEQLLIELIPADPRLGKAYGLGRALADSCHEPTDLAGLKRELNPYRIANLLRWLDDLATGLPPHAAHSVAISLARWRDALHPPNDGRLPGTRNPWRKLQFWRERRRRPGAITDSHPGNAEHAVKALRRQGELWRALLSGEKQGTDMLEIDNYLDAGKELARRMAAIGWRAAWRMPLLSLLVAGLVAAGIWLLSQGSSSQLVAGATSVLAALGLTWKGLGGALGKLAGKLEQPLWGAVLDQAIADAITLLPDNSAEHGGRRQVALAVNAEDDAEDPGRHA